ncbi:hypothetical protein Tco_0357256 [Tanacetum coccineum]
MWGCHLSEPDSAYVPYYSTVDWSKPTTCATMGLYSGDPGLVVQFHSLPRKCGRLSVDGEDGVTNMYYMLLKDAVDTVMEVSLKPKTLRKVSGTILANYDDGREFSMESYHPIQSCYYALLFRAQSPVDSNDGKILLVKYLIMAVSIVKENSWEVLRESKTGRQLLWTFLLPFEEEQAEFKVFSDVSISPKGATNGDLSCLYQCKTAKEMWNDLILAHEGPSYTRDTKIAALRLTFNAFKSLEEDCGPSVKVSPIYVIKKKTEKSPTGPKPCSVNNKKRLESSTASNFFFTLIEEVKVSKCKLRSLQTPLYQAPSQVVLKFPSKRPGLDPVSTVGLGIISLMIATQSPSTLLVDPLTT